MKKNVICKDHPRIRGDNLEKSSFKRIISRITPAFAGITSPGMLPKGKIEDHPRIRGDNLLISLVK